MRLRQLANGALVLYGGVLSDRLPRNRILVGAAIGQCAAQAATAAVVLSGSATLALLVVLQVVYGAADAFVIPAEIQNMYAKDGRQSPVTGWTGLWLFPFGVFIFPAIVWFVKVQGALNRYWEGRAPEAVATAPA